MDVLKINDDDDDDVQEFMFGLLKQGNLLDFRLQSLECALMRNELLRMRANEKPPTQNTRSRSALLRYVLQIMC